MTAWSRGSASACWRWCATSRGIVDNYKLRVDGMPDGVVVDLPGHGVPGAVRHRRDVRAGGRDPPAPAAHARRPRRKLWNLQVVAHSKAHETHGHRGAVRARRSSRTSSTHDQGPPGAQEGPPQGRLRRVGREQGQRAGADRARGRGPRRRAAVRLQPPAGRRSRPGRRSTARMRVRPPKQIWIGRPHERRFEVITLTGEEAEERLAAEPPPPTSCAARPRRPRRACRPREVRRLPASTARACTSRRSTRPA